MLQLIRSPDCNILWLVVREEELQTLLNDVTSDKIESHDAGNHDLEFGGEGDKLELLVEFGNELGGTGEGNTGDGNESPVHALVLADGLTEGSALVVNGKGRDLLNEL